MLKLREQRILALHEAGVTAPRIAQDMGIKVGSVRRTLTLLCGNLGPDRRHEMAMTRGSQALRVAIERARAN